MSILAIIAKSSLLVKFDAAIVKGDIVNPATRKVDMRSVKSLAVKDATVKGSDGKDYPLMAVCVKMLGGNPVTEDLRTSDFAVKAGEVMREYLMAERPDAGWVNANTANKANPKAALANLDAVTF
jgi:hypothetical protein